MESKIRVSCFCIVLLLSLAACSKPLPDNKKHFAGLWQSNNMSLLITLDGRVDYQRVKSDNFNKTVSVNAPIQEFTETGFIVGFMGLTTEFIVSQPPTQKGGQWFMIVDDVKLIKSEAVNEA